MLELAVKILAAYFLGTALGSLLLGYVRGVDIREMGSGNAGATNAMRTQGRLFGIAVLAIDIGKGVLAAAWLPGALLPGVGIDPQLPREWLCVACAFAVIIGHVYPVFFEFRGGKGFATMLGALAAVEWRLLPPLLLTWCVVLWATGYVGLAAIVSGCMLAAAACIFDVHNEPLLCFCFAVAGLVLYTHRANIARMRAGKEHRIRRWAFRSRTA